MTPTPDAADGNRALPGPTSPPAPPWPARDGRGLVPQRREASPLRKFAIALAAATPAGPAWSLVRRRIATCSLLFAWICANGAIWDAMQVFAWGKMFAGYAATMNVTAALRETLDPAKPCEMCVGVAQAKETAKQQLPAAVEHSAEKLQLALHAPAVFVPANDPGAWPAAVADFAPSRTEAVPVPPPRA